MDTRRIELVGGPEVLESHFCNGALTRQLRFDPRLVPSGFICMNSHRLRRSKILKRERKLVDGVIRSSSLWYLSKFRTFDAAPSKIELIEYPRMSLPNNFHTSPVFLDSELPHYGQSVHARCALSSLNTWSLLGSAKCLLTLMRRTEPSRRESVACRAIGF